MVCQDCGDWIDGIGRWPYKVVEVVTELYFTSTCIAVPSRTDVTILLSSTEYCIYVNKTRYCTDYCGV